MKLRCVGVYRNDVRNLRFAVGDEFEAEGELLDFLQTDAPDCFEEVKPKPRRKAPTKPAADKAVKEPAGKK